MSKRKSSARKTTDTRKISDFIAAIESRIPPKASESWDNVGLMTGDARQALRGVVIGVDLTEALLREAIRTKANVIIIHHPPLFPKGRGVGRLKRCAMAARGAFTKRAKSFHASTSMT